MNLRSAILGCLALLLFSLDVIAGPPDLTEIHTGGFEVTAIDGARIPLAELIPAGRPAVVEFWATWCAPCRKTTPSLQKLFTRYGSADLSVLGLTIEDFGTDIEKVTKFASEEGITFPIAFSSRELFQFMNQRDEVAVPKILIFDGSGKVVEHITSYSPLTARRVARAVARALGGE